MVARSLFTVGKLVHRKPVRGWGVVLLSTLLLSSSPTAATALLHALAQAAGFSGNAFAAVPAASGSVVASSSPRRAEEKAARITRSERLLRLDIEPDAALVFPARGVLLVPDEDTGPRVLLSAISEPVPSRPIVPTSPRAPPV